MFATVIISSLIVAFAVVIHYEMLRQLSILIPRMSLKSRFRVLFGLFGALIAHIIEVLIFACGFYLMVNASWPGFTDFGDLANLDGGVSHSMRDCAYFSFSSYTSLGLGDIFPVGNIRFLTGLEALTGLVLITWTASFMYMEMQKFWHVQ